jgi:septum site-determining protein MinC
LSRLCSQMMKNNSSSATSVAVSIKGTKDGLVVSLGHDRWKELVKELEEHLRQQGSFFDGADAILEVGTRELSADRLTEIREVLQIHHMELQVVRASSGVTREAAAALGIRTERASSQREGKSGSSADDRQGGEALLLRQTIRSGQSVQYPGHITIVGDVNPGAQVVAGGDIVVWGRVRGVLHAGATGDKQAVVCALVLTPTQLRISDQIARPPDGETRDPPVPEVARVQDNGIVVSAWNVARL